MAVPYHSRISCKLLWVFGLGYGTCILNRIKHVYVFCVIHTRLDNEYKSRIYGWYNDYNYVHAIASIAVFIHLLELMLQ